MLIRVIGQARVGYTNLYRQIFKMYLLARTPKYIEFAGKLPKKIQIKRTKPKPKRGKKKDLPRKTKSKGSKA